MKKIQILVLLMLSMQSISMYAAQELPQNLQQSRQTMIDHAVKNHPCLTESFDFLQTQNLVDTSFHDFLEQNVSYHEDSHEEIQFDQAIVNAQDIITKNMKITFLNNMILGIRKIDLDTCDDPIFLYVMKHENGHMSDFVRVWLHETGNLLKFAAYYGNAKIVRMCLTAGCDVNVQDQNGITPLGYIAKNFDYCGSHTKIVKMLIAAGAHVNIQDEYSNTPLMYAACFNNTEIVRMLIGAGAQVNIQNKYGRTPLHEAALKNKPVIVSMLLAAGGNVNIQNKRGWTPLHLAACFGETEMVNMFVAAGADVDIQDKDGRTAVQEARTLKIENILKKQQKIAKA
ncbi:ankyrin repeat domain-containing protein [Candidatus Chromulinivorax destructor]|uniref:Uncharacterized protein n=1 Tax=Candidatus Chromulinivorax destructor TaxID=2066483 RepID=A0A345ZA81_9BACT|nr:ankyrin repeat domain-containing protein [Candidatus Chromulinivorax destructor]AXK60198.1 hypothetical protein C0J27_00335 [Candidatus Chromulinivorax destructor]